VADIVVFRPEGFRRLAGLDIDLDQEDVGFRRDGSAIGTFAQGDRLLRIRR
jgi:hypothetical protein